VTRLPATLGRAALVVLVVLTVLLGRRFVPAGVSWPARVAILSALVIGVLWAASRGASALEAHRRRS
jgi:uncharacterized integral membrane protein